MKYVFKCIVLIGLLLLLIIMAAPSVLAESAGEDWADLYQKQFESSGADALQEMLPDTVREQLEGFGLDPSDPTATTNAEPKQFFTLIWETLAGGIAQPLAAVMAIVGVLMILSAAEGLITAPDSTVPVGLVCFLAVLALLEPMTALTAGMQEVMQQISTFMLAFVPVYAGLLASSGHMNTAGGFSALLLAAAEGISQFISHVFLPVVGGSVCLGVSGSISPISGFARLAEWIKKAVLWCMGIVITVFLAVLSGQTAITAAGDNLGIRTSKAVIAGGIPVMGPAIAETLNTARGCLTLLRSGVGIYGAAAVALLALPLLIQMLCWRLGLWLCTGAAELFGIPQAAKLFQMLDFCLAMLIGAVTFIAMLFIIAMTIVARVA